jgi:O-methyltransferase
MARRTLEPQNAPARRPAQALARAAEDLAGPAQSRNNRALIGGSMSRSTWWSAVRERWNASPWAAKLGSTWNDAKPLSAKLGERWSALKGVEIPTRLNALHRVVTLPFSIFFLTYDAKVHPAYEMTQFRRATLALRFFWNNARMTSASSYKSHLVMAMKLLELPPDVEGSVVECGCYKGAMTVNLSLVCKIAGRKLKVYDSFEGLPEPTSHDCWPPDVAYVPGVFKGSLEEVKANVRRFGAIDVCEFHKGWFKDTLPRHEGAVAMTVVDVDYHSSLYDCVTKLWPFLVERGFFFVDEYVFPDYCAIFYSEKFWLTHFQCDPPGLIGAGSGVQVGEYYLGPWNELWMSHNPGSIAYTRKGERAAWTYYPSSAAHETDAEPKPGSVPDAPTSPVSISR